MPSFTTSVANLEGIGPVVDLNLAVPSAVENILRQANQPIPAPIAVQAMFDTGATASVLQKGLAARLGLNPVGTTRVNTPSSTNVLCYEYAVRYVFSNNVVVEGTMIEAPLQGQHIECLLGRDVLAHGVFVYIGYANLFSFSL